MKTFILTAMIAVFLLFYTNELQAQSTQTQLNQLELIKQFIGNWTCEMGKDTTVFCEYKLFGTGIEDYYKAITKGKIFLSDHSCLVVRRIVKRYLSNLIFLNFQSLAFLTNHTSKLLFQNE